MNLNTNFMPAYEIDSKLEIIMDPMNYLQALAFLHLLGVLHSAHKYTSEYISYLNDPYVKQDVQYVLAETRGKKEVHYGIYTECPSHAMELGVASGCGPITPGLVSAPANSRFYGDGKGTISAFLVATNTFPSYYHLRELNDTFRIWCMYPLLIRENEIIWMDPRRDADGQLPKEDTYIYDLKFIWSDEYIKYQKWLYKEYEAEILEWEWWSVY